MSAAITKKKKIELGLEFLGLVWNHFQLLVSSLDLQIFFVSFRFAFSLSLLSLRFSSHYSKRFLFFLNWTNGERERERERRRKEEERTKKERQSQETKRRKCEKQKK